VAFSAHAPFFADALFIVVHLCLMPAFIEERISWEDYIQRQFERHISRYFSRGVSCVVLAFDDYANVPPAKNMTQTKRRRNVPSLEFHARDALPPCVPRGEDFTRCISNRAFKAKVIQLVVHRLTTGLQCAEGQCLVVDYCGAPVRHYARSLQRPPEAIPGLDRRLGEADVKFVGYADLFAKLQVDSVDGDTLPIALLHMERGHSGRLSVLRLQTRVKGDDADKENQVPAKRGQAGDAAPARRSRVYEFVDVSALYQTLVCMVVPQAIHGSRLPSHEGHEISMLSCLIGLSGTDFTRGLPLVSGKSLYEFLPDLWVRLSRCYDPAARQVLPGPALDLLVSRIYHCKFPRHTSDCDLKGVLKSLGDSKLSEKTKARLPSEETVRCTLQNVNWLLRYWHELSPPDPVQAEFGYARSRTGAVQFAA
jgi:hypothetical protein